MYRLKEASSVRAIVAIAMVVSFAIFAFAQHPIAGTKGATPEAGATPQITNAYVPEVSIAHPENAGMIANTNYVLRSENGARPSALGSPSITEAETPASMGCVYHVGPIYPGCNPATGGSNHPTGGFGAIALVDAYDNPDAASDLAYFTSYWGLPAASFAKIYCTTAAANGGCYTTNAPPAGNTGWGLEEALDIEWAHVMAPNAVIYLVEAADSGCADLFYAANWAGQYVQAAGGGEVSNSWTCGEFSGEASYDSNFYNSYAKTSYFASAGDAGHAANYPASSPWVIAAGGTTVNRNATTKNFVNETCWSGSGGGFSAYETAQGNQFLLVAGGKRAIPDLSFNADPKSGVWVYDAYNGGWYMVGGTSVASPALAGIVDNAGNKVGQGTAFLFQGFGYRQNLEAYLIYSQLTTAKAYKSNFYDVVSGSNGYSAYPLYDLCTGVGSPRGLLGK